MVVTSDSPAQCDDGHCHVTGKHPLPRTEQGASVPTDSNHLAISKERQIDPTTFGRPGNKEKGGPRSAQWLVASSIDIWRRYYDLTIGFDRPFHEPPLRPGLGERGWFKVNFKRIILPSFLELAILHGLIGAVETRRDSNWPIVDAIRNGTKRRVASRLATNRKRKWMKE